MNIVLVEDDQLTRKAIIKALMISGLEIEKIYEADNGEKGLQLLENNIVDIGLVDLNLCGMNGDEMVQQMKKNPNLKRVPIVFITGEKNMDRVKNIENQGLIKKPFTPETLGEAILNGIS